MTFNDFLQGTDLAGSSISAFGMAATLLLAFSLGLFIFWIYKRTYQGVMYSKTFNISLIALTMITASIIMAVTSNIILSLGMVGALSIVRFRTAIKDPMDVIYMFWAISAGIIVGAGLYLLAVVSSLVLGVILYSFSKMTVKNEPYLLIVDYSDSEVEDALFKVINEKVGTYKIKSKTKTGDRFELTVEIRSKKENTILVNEIDNIDSVQNTALISYDGEYAA
ncbi:MAG TPA: DUF4956 domain-containing protein [Thermotogota bacterium]|nr:DUF4956 domain-containing protein [Thermotogota bacterium]HPJ88734.1 DUF4956 domain-containing protein [Thermotogota bacterium]HPR97184.1 DUF4956 domain-containing protein [Thermotogota bacterium]